VLGLIRCKGYNVYRVYKLLYYGLEVVAYRVSCRCIIRVKRLCVLYVLILKANKCWGNGVIAISSYEL
jgi:hypothetical protein